MSRTCRWRRCACIESFERLQRKIPADLARVIRVQCLHKWKHSVFSEEELLDEFMPQTRREVVEHVLGDVVSNVAMFKYVDNSDFLTNVILKFIPVSTNNHDNPIQTIHDPGPDLFVVLRGRVSLLDENGEVIGVAGKGTAIFENELLSSMGKTEQEDCPERCAPALYSPKFEPCFSHESCFTPELLSRYRAPYSVQPTANSELYMLRRTDFIQLIKEYPNVCTPCVTRPGL